MARSWTTCGCRSVEPEVWTQLQWATPLTSQTMTAWANPRYIIQHQSVNDGECKDLPSFSIVEYVCLLVLTRWSWYSWSLTVSTTLSSVRRDWRRATTSRYHPPSHSSGSERCSSDKGWIRYSRENYGQSFLPSPNRRSYIYTKLNKIMMKLQLFCPVHV